MIRGSRTFVHLSVAVGVIAPALIAGDLMAEPYQITLMDDGADAVVRRTDPGGDGPFDPALRSLVDLKAIMLAQWEPDDPLSDLFEGAYTDQGAFLRMDLMLTGLVNPPGPTDPIAFDAFAFGDNPVYGFVEIDMDGDADTGGEIDAPQYRYLGNIARFGGLPSRPDWFQHMALDAAAFDDDFLTRPFVERHGEEFHLALLGGLFDADDIEEIAGDGDFTFERGETWIIRAPLFHRAHGYERFSLAQGGARPGEYSPMSTLRFRHDPSVAATTLSLVFPLTNGAAGLMRDEQAEPMDNDPSDQASVAEALLDLQQSAQFVYLYPTGLPEEDILLNWRYRGFDAYLNPARWLATALLGTSYTTPDPSGEYFVWTDAYPNVLRGDFNGDGGCDAQDALLISDFINLHDAADGWVDQRVKIVDYASNFSVYDVYYDGAVDNLDSLLCGDMGDTDKDSDIDLADFQLLQSCFSKNPHSIPACIPADLNSDDNVDLKDGNRLGSNMTGPGDQ